MKGPHVYKSHASHALKETEKSCYLYHLMGKSFYFKIVVAPEQTWKGPMYVNLMQFFQSHAGWTPSVGHLRFWHFYQTFRLEKGKCELKRVTFTRLSDYKSESESFLLQIWAFLGIFGPLATSQHWNPLPSFHFWVLWKSATFLQIWALFGPFSISY